MVEKLEAPEGYDDRPLHTEPGQMGPEVLAPLAPFAGAEPPAPEWFRQALAQAPERSFVESLGSQIELLTWGERGKPGLLLVHGNSAHADWWSCIAPLLAQDYRVAAMSLAGMGASDWRDTYVLTDFARDAKACAEAAGLHDSGAPPVYIGHSFGGMQVFVAAVTAPEQMRAAILVDSGVVGPRPGSEEARRMEAVRNIPTADRAAKIYRSLPEALARFRLMPPQEPGNLFIADYIARKSLRTVTMEDGSEGFTWRFDPNMWAKLDQSLVRSWITEGPPPLRAPVAHIYGDRSAIYSRLAAGERSLLPEGTLEIAIPDCAHHVMIDQPLALVAALRTLLGVWPS